MPSPFHNPGHPSSHSDGDVYGILTKADYVLLEKKIVFMEKLPGWIWQGGFGMLGVMVGMFAAIGGLSWMFGLFAISYVIMLVIVQIFVRKYFSKLHKDISVGNKRVVTGLIEIARQQDKDRKKTTNSPPISPAFGFEWVVAGKIYSIDKEMFDTAGVGEMVELLILPESQLVYGVGRVVQDLDHWTGQ